MLCFSENIDTNWDLNKLYNSIEDEYFDSDMLKIDKEIAEIKNLLNQKDEIFSSNLLAVLQKIDSVNLIFNKISSYVNLSLMVNLFDEKLIFLSDKISKIQVSLKQILKLLKYKVGNLNNIDEIIIKIPNIKPYIYLLKESSKKIKNDAPIEIEEIISQMQINGGNAWQTLRDKIDSSIKVPITINGEKKSYSLTQARSFAYSYSQNTRFAAYRAEINSYKNYEDVMASCLNAIKGEALNILEFRNHNTILEEMLEINKMDKETLDVMIASIEEYLPIFQEYLKVKSQLLGHKNGLPWYNLFAPVAKNTKEFSYKNTYKYLTKVFSTFDKDMGGFVKNAFENRWIDVYPKQNKSGGALCADIPSINESRVFINFDKSFSSVSNLAHELGHAFHSKCLDEIPMIMRDPPTPICETASLFNEIIVQEDYLSSASQKELLYTLDTIISEATQKIVDIYSRFIFEKQIFERRKNGNLFASELCEIMKSSQVKAYGNSLDKKYLHPYMWMCKVHYYIPEFHYYNFPYTFGLLFAKGLYAQHKQNPKNFMTKYKELLKYSCSDNLIGIAKRVDIDLHDKSFWDDSLDMIIKDIKLFNKLSRDLL